MANMEPAPPQAAAAKPTTRPATNPRPKQLPPYNVVLLDDNEHTYDYVIDMLRSLFAHSEEKAYQLAEQVDRTGRAIVCTTHQERAELKRDQILGHGCDFRNPKSKSSMKALVEPAQG